MRLEVIDPVYPASANKLLLEGHITPELPAALNNICCGLAWQVPERLNLPEGE